ncbi:MAG TPA: hypothetical protein PJ991_03870 [Kiritimatiellia bacterium]|nr:hypothetical protein [Kiritimatiellia bacterium]
MKYRHYIACMMTTLLIYGAGVRGATNVMERSNPALPQAGKVVASHQRNFYITGTNPTLSLELAIWAESLRQRLEALAGTSIPGEHANPIVIEAVVHTNEPVGRAVAVQQADQDGRVRQAVTLINMDDMDQEDILEAISGLLLNRWIHARQSADERRSRPGAFPEWFAVALAQNLYPELKERNLRVVENAEAMLDYTPASRVFLHERFAPGRWREKAHAGLVGSWLVDFLSGPMLITKAAEQIARHGTLSPTSIQLWLEVKDQRSFDMAWDVWMARQIRRVVPGTHSDDPRTIARILEMRPEDLGVFLPEGLTGSRISVDILLANRDKNWVGQICQALAWKLQQASIGRSPELVAALRPVVVFFNELPKNTERRRQKIVSDKKLRGDWQTAMDAWNTFVRESGERRNWIESQSSDHTVDATAFRRWIDSQYDNTRDSP